MQSHLPRWRIGYKVVQGLHVRKYRTDFRLFLSHESAPLNVLQKSLNILGPCLSNIIIIMYFFFRTQCMSCTRLLLMNACWPSGPSGLMLIV